MNPNSWSYINTSTIGSNNIGHAPFVNKYPHTVPANETLELELSISNNNTVTGEITHIIYLAPDSANTAQTFTISHTVN